MALFPLFLFTLSPSLSLSRSPLALSLFFLSSLALSLPFSLYPVNKKKKEQERSQALIDKLLEEKKRQEDNNQLVLSWLRQGKNKFLSSRKYIIYMYMYLIITCMTLLSNLRLTNEKG